MLAISTKAQTRTNKSRQQGVGDENGVIRVVTQAAALGLAGLDLLRRLPACPLGLSFLSGFALESLSLGGGLDLLVEEVRVDGLDVGCVDVNQGGGAFGLVLVNAAEGGSATGSSGRVRI